MDRGNTPENSVFLTLGPSMANIIQFYGHGARTACQSAQTRSTEIRPISRLATPI